MAQTFCGLEKAGSDLVLVKASGSSFTMTSTFAALCTRRADPVSGAGEKPMEQRERNL